MDLLKIIILSFSILLGMTETTDVEAADTNANFVSDAQLAQLQTIEGKPASVGKDNKKLLYFWATWCPTCRQKLQNGELKNLDAAPGIDVIAVNTDKEADRAANYVAKHKPEVNIVRDPAKAILDPLKVQAVPYWAVVERDPATKAWKITAAKTGGELPEIRTALGL